MTYEEATGKSISDNFAAFHADNPHIYTMMIDIIGELRAQGAKRFSLETVWERMRWLKFFETTNEPTRFKLNDVYASRYARLIMAQEPGMAGFFKTRKLREDKDTPNT